MGQYLQIHFQRDEPPFTSYFYVHQRYRVLTHCHITLAFLSLVWDSRVLNHCIMFFAGKIHRLRDWLQPGFMLHSFPKGVSENHKVVFYQGFIVGFVLFNGRFMFFLLKPSISPQDGGFTNHPPAKSYALRGVRGVTFTASLQLGQDWCSNLMHSDG